MPVTAELNDLDNYFKSISEKIIVNDIPPSSDGMEVINENIMTTYDKDIIDNAPSCDCGMSKSRYLLGAVCEFCGSKVQEPHNKKHPVLWLKNIHPTKKFINPYFWLMLKEIMGGKHDYIRWMCDKKYQLPAPAQEQAFLKGIEKNILKERSYDEFIDKFPAIMNFLMEHSKFKLKEDEFRMLLDMWYKKETHSDYLPLLNNRLFVMEKTTKGKFVNLVVSDMYDIIMTWLNVCKDMRMGIKKIDYSSVTANIISKFATLISEYHVANLYKKPGILRKHIYGMRSPFTFRAVITAIPGKYQHDEIHVPWVIGVTAFRPHLLNKLKKLGYSYRAMNEMLDKAVTSYDPLLGTLLDELVAEAPDGKLYVLTQRNPSLLPGSMQRVNVIFKKNIEDKTLGVGGLIIKAPNGKKYLTE